MPKTEGRSGVALEGVAELNKEGCHPKRTEAPAGTPLRMTRVSLGPPSKLSSFPSRPLFPLVRARVDVGLHVAAVAGESASGEVFFLDDFDVLRLHHKARPRELEDDLGLRLLEHDHGKGVALVHHPLRAVGEIDGQGVEEHAIEGKALLFFRGPRRGGHEDEDGEEKEDEFHAGGIVGESWKKSTPGRATIKGVMAWEGSLGSTDHGLTSGWGIKILTFLSTKAS